ncbi:MAG: hypothetical protein NTY02_12570, partial [Acidobacteria bacterium]|nr:hypothetical protein [Acidobacteriota bacterium]
SAELVPRPPVELTHFGRSAVIVVKSTKVIERLPGVSLVPLPDGRALISLSHEMHIADFEIVIRDAMDAPGRTPTERAMLELLGSMLRTARQARGVTLSQRNIIVLERRKTRNNGQARGSAL